MAAKKDELRIKSSKSCNIVNDIKTDVVCYNFTNRIFIILTQFGRPGTMVRCRCFELWLCSSIESINSSTPER